MTIKLLKRELNRTGLVRSEFTHSAMLIYIPVSSYIVGVKM